MGEMDDDFGDLYADVELQVSAAINEISGFNQLYIENDNKNESSSVDDLVASESRSKKVNPISQESTMCSKDDAGRKEDLKLIENGTETLDLEADGEEKLLVDSGSDSEDDLLIVLNEDDCRKYPVPRDAVTGNRGLTEGSDDEDDDFVIVTDANLPSNDRNLLDQLQSSCDGVEQAALCSGAEKGNGMKSSHLSQYSQYKYIRPVNSKGNVSGAAVPVYSLLPGKGDWDVNGSNQQMVSNMPHIGSSSSTVSPFVSQRGYDFSLPRYRTILDVNIDRFEWKPWRHPGADITDFFNFDLDEESWKEYCNRLEQFRQQANMLAKAPESIRLNRVYGVEFEQAAVASEAVAGESGQIGDATNVSLSFNSADRGGKRLEVPKGRAIQVEGGIGERQPSMDVRRPRNRDSDVVIQIAVHDSGDSAGSSEQEDHVDNTVLEISKSRDSEIDDNSDMHDTGGARKDAQSIEPVDESSNRFGISHVKDHKARRWTRCSQPTAKSNALTLDSDSQVNENTYDVDMHHRQKEKGHVLEDEKMIVIEEQTKELVVNGIPSKADPLLLEAESSLGNQIQCSVSSSYLDGHSKEPNDGTDTLKTLERPSSHSAAELWESVAIDDDNYKDSESNDSDMESGEYKYGSEDPSPNYVKQNCCSRMQLRSGAELKDHRDDDEEATLMSNRKDRFNGDCPKVGHGTHKRWRHHNGIYDREDFSYYRGTEVSTGCHSDRSVDRQARNGCTEKFRGIPQHFEEDMDPFPTRHWDEKDYLIDQRTTAEYNKREDYHERGYTKDRIKSISYKKSRSLSGHSSLYKEKARNFLQRRKRDEESRFRKRTLDDEYESEHRCIDELRQKYGRHVPYNDREPLKKYDRHIPYIGREIENSGKINRYCCSPHPELDTSWSSAGYDDEFWRHPDHPCTAVDTSREFEIVKERRWQDITSPRNEKSDSRRSDERYFDHWRRIKHRDSWIDPMCENVYRTEDDTIYLDDDIFKKRRRSSRRSEAFHWDENNLCSRHQDQDDMYAEEAPSSFKRNKRHERIHVEREPTHHGYLLNEQIGSKIIREEIRISEISSHGNSGINIICRVKHEQAALRSRDSTLGGWEGKPSGRCSKAGDVRCNGGHSHMDQMVDYEQTVFGDSDEAHTREAILPYRSKVASRISRSKIEVRQCKLKPSTNDKKGLDKHPDTQYHEASDFEEGQLAEPEKKEIGAIEQRHVSGSTTGIGDVKGGKGFGCEQKGFGVYDNHRILEALVKMEKRRERFKEPIPLKESAMNSKPEPAPTIETAGVKRRERFKEPIPLKVPVKNPKPEPPPTVETVDIKQQRPLRKRRWAGA
ncbi:hypothetical protein NE237_012110 [Protea cynaroides]|uniref:Pre-mRNA polyadenylation factor Fip1 domain-containing protein n=1 Tax=Protea cynaroides TaxID=273540 RepID=A0A9Q0GW91_9MAGN|nr:hypothetical protein NE237_012110 [Protea cynaroides]